MIFIVDLNHDLNQQSCQPSFQVFIESALLIRRNNIVSTKYASIICVISAPSVTRSPLNKSPLSSMRRSILESTLATPAKLDSTEVSNNGGLSRFAQIFTLTRDTLHWFSAPPSIPFKMLTLMHSCPCPTAHHREIPHAVLLLCGRFM